MTEEKQQGAAEGTERDAEEQAGRPAPVEIDDEDDAGSEGEARAPGEAG